MLMRQGCALTTVNAEVLLQVVLVLERFAAFCALEFPVASGLRDVPL